jgi:hypothetical protein
VAHLEWRVDAPPLAGMILETRWGSLRSAHANADQTNRHSKARWSHRTPAAFSAAAGDDVAQESTAQPIGKIYNRDVYGN